jgi:two-component system, cell cycle response regulator
MKDMTAPPRAKAAAPRRQHRILIADDDPVSSRILDRSVREWGFKAIHAANGSAAWSILKDDRTRLALLDWEMPEADGPELCRRIRAEAKANYTYIILLTARDDPRDIVAGLKAGADDYMTKPLKFQELRARLQTGQRIVELEDKLLEAQKRLYDLAAKDGLTGLWNRRTIIQFLDNALAHGQRASTPTSIIMIDVDHFKSINDTCGHQAGDKVLTVLSSRLDHSVRPYDRIGRYGGDEILVVLPDCSLESAAAIAGRLRLRCIRKPAQFARASIGFTLSLGCASSEGIAHPSADRLILAGDQALYEAKRLGRDQIIAAAPAGTKKNKGKSHVRPEKN